jgi:hypothetical protein
MTVRLDGQIKVTMKKVHLDKVDCIAVQLRGDVGGAGVQGGGLAPEEVAPELELATCHIGLPCLSE